MVTSPGDTEAKPQFEASGVRRNTFPYDQWMESAGIPIYKGHYVGEPKTLELGWWAERECNAAFIQLKGQEGVSEARITEIPPGKTLPPLKLGVGEVVYVLEGQGLATVWGSDEGTKKSFEWQKSSLFHLPRHCYHQFSNARGDRPARLLNYNYLPVAMSVVPEPDFFFNNPYQASDVLNSGETPFYSEAKLNVEPGEGKWSRGRAVWQGNFFPDMTAWDKLVPFWGRGAGGTVVFIKFPDSGMGCHMSVFDPQLYKKGHRHGPGRVIVIPEGEGYSILWPEGGEKVVCPWQEASIFVPPENWYHQHFNIGKGQARYLALAPIPQFQGTAYRHQIEYPDEDAFIREKFEGELAKQGLESLMVKQAYEDRDYEWDYGEDN